MIQIFLGVGFFTAIITLLAFIIVMARRKLVPSGEVTILVNENPDNAVVTNAGGKLLNVLADNEIYVSSACGGGGSCGQCKVKITEGGGKLLPTEKTHINRKEAQEGYKLSCQTTVKEDMKIELPPEVFSAKQWDCEVISNVNVGTYIKEVVLKLPENMDFKAGGYIQIIAPPFEASTKDIDIPERFQAEWDELPEFKIKTTETIQRAYSMANYPLEEGIIKLNVRIALPPDYNPKLEPGKGSTFMHTRKPGDKVSITGPFGDFYAREGDSEMIFIGGGAGMAPLRSIIFDQLKRVKTNRKITFWYGARSLKELFYREDFDKLAEEHENFSWEIALSDPLDEDDWKGYIGYIHRHVYNSYLKDHDAPEDCQYYLCGPPPMLDASLKTLDHSGVEEDKIFFDDFGS